MRGERLVNLVGAILMVPLVAGVILGVLALVAGVVR